MYHLNYELPVAKDSQNLICPIHIKDKVSAHRRADRCLGFCSLNLFGSFTSMPMRQRKQGFTVAEVSQTSIFGQIHINTNVLAHKPYFLDH